MIGRILKWIGIGLVGIIVVIIALVGVISTIRWNQAYENIDVKVERLGIPAGDEAVLRGKHIATTHYCSHCHGENLAGDYLVNEPVLAVISAPNLTAGDGGVGVGNGVEDWVRAIRHGVGHDGRGLVGMPSRIWFQMSDEDLGALIAYLQTLPPVDQVQPERRIGPMFRLLLTLGQAPPSEAALIDHNASRPQMPDPGVTAAYGEYLAMVCTACHGDDMAGGTIRDFDGELIVALNLTPGGELLGWAEDDFIAAMRTGMTPGGRQLSEAMPWRYFAEMTDEELQALWMYLESLPSLEQSLVRVD